jgi:hypothetical protein
MNQQTPLPYRVAARALLHCIGSTGKLLAEQRLHLPRQHVGMRLRFADGTSARVYRETVVERGPTQEPCVLVVEFRLRFLRGWGHTLFRWESLLNTPLFAGFPGFGPSCGWLTTSGASIAASTSGTGRGAPSTTPAACGACLPLASCQARSTTWCCPDFTATT